MTLLIPAAAVIVTVLTLTLPRYSIMRRVHRRDVKPYVYTDYWRR